jgi:hypothetical protein
MADRISGFKDKMDIKEKTEESIDKRCWSCKRNTQDLCGFIKRLDL